MAHEAYGLLAEFDSPEALVEAVRAARREGYARIDAFTPFPVDALTPILGLRDARIPRLCFAGAVTGALAALAIQLYANYDYPLNAGGRPVYALSAFAVVTFELTILFAAGFVFVAFLYLNGLPRLNYPVFSARRFPLASRDRFFLCVKGDDAKFDRDATTRFLRGLGALTVEFVPP